jgi:ABC-type transport system substrate-binding protein
VYEREGLDWHRAVPLVGNGPFVLTARGDDRVVLETSPSWRGARGNVGEVTIEIEASRAVAAERWRCGEYDVLDDFLSGLAVADGETVVQRSPGMTTSYLGFDASQAPFDDARVRRALAHAIDRNGPVKFRGAVAAEAGGFLPPTMPGHSHRVAPTFDPERARALLHEAGYADGHALGEIVLMCSDRWEETASDIAAQLERIGVRVRLLSVATDSDEIAVLAQRAAHAYLYPWMAGDPDPGSGFLESFLAAEFPIYRDEELEQLLAHAASLRDQDERLRTYREFERIWIGEKAALVPLMYNDRPLWRRPWVRGMWMNAIARSTFAEAVVSRTRL